MNPLINLNINNKQIPICQIEQTILFQQTFQPHKYFLLPLNLPFVKQVYIYALNILTDNDNHLHPQFYSIYKEDVDLLPLSERYNRANLILAVYCSKNALYLISHLPPKIHEEDRLAYQNLEKYRYEIYYFLPSVQKLSYYKLLNLLGIDQYLSPEAIKIQYLTHRKEDLIPYQTDYIYLNHNPYWLKSLFKLFNVKNLEEFKAKIDQQEIFDLNFKPLMGLKLKMCQENLRENLNKKERKDNDFYPVYAEPGYIYINQENKSYLNLREMFGLKEDILNQLCINLKE